MAASASQAVQRWLHHKPAHTTARLAFLVRERETALRLNDLVGELV